MKVLVFAHVPPPHHGQSFMVKQLLDNLGKITSKGSEEIELFHVNARFSDGADDIGSWRPTKFFRLIKYILQAWWMRWKYSIDAFYYVPAPPKRSAIYRDWMVLFLVTPVFKSRIFHWHSAGLGEWVTKGKAQGGFSRLEASITERLYFRHELSCVCNEWGKKDADVFSPQRIDVVENGIPDPCPDFSTNVLPERLQRCKQRSVATEQAPAIFKIAYLALATRSKGLFDVVEAVSKANAQLSREHSGLRIRLTVAGAFINDDEEQAFHTRVAQDDLRLDSVRYHVSHAVVYAGFLNSGQKDHLLRDTDALCFASFFPNECQPVSIIEALAYGMPVLLSRWRSLPDMIPPSLSYLVAPEAPDEIAQALLTMSGDARFEEYRQHFLTHYTLAAHCESLREGFLSVSSAGSG